MDTIQYIILACVIIFIISRTLFADRSPIPETSGNVHKVSEASEFDALLSSTTYVVVDFYADWCPPCRAIAPTFSKLADDYALKGQLAFAKVNVDQLQDVGKLYDITAMPTFLFFKDGKLKPVVVQGNKGSASATITEDRGVERIRGADVGLLRSVVRALAEKVQS